MLSGDFDPFDDEATGIRENTEAGMRATTGGPENDQIPAPPIVSDDDVQVSQNLKGTVVEPVATFGERLSNGWTRLKSGDMGSDLFIGLDRYFEGDLSEAAGIEAEYDVADQSVGSTAWALRSFSVGSSATKTGFAGLSFFLSMARLASAAACLSAAFLMLAASLASRASFDACRHAALRQ